MSNNFKLTSHLPEYIFSSINKMKQDVIKKNIDIIDCGMGNPDIHPPQEMMNYMSELVLKPELYRYSKAGGIDDLKKSVQNYYKRRFNVNLDYNSEILVTIGAKEGISSLALAISDKKRYVITPNPCYPIHNFAFTISNSKIISLDASEPDIFLENIKLYLNKEKNNKPFAIIVNYPCNPTTKIVDLSFYEELVDICLHHNIYIISDLAYCEIYFDNKYKPNSILEVKNADKVAIEFTSISKTYSMAGCRVGFACGNKELISALNKIKSYLDYGSFEPIQMVASKSLSERFDNYLQDIRDIYKKRADLLHHLIINKLGWADNIKPKATMFYWIKLPDHLFIENGGKYKDSFDFTADLLYNEGVALSPGTCFGSLGNKYVRFSLIHNDDILVKAIDKIFKFIEKISESKNNF